MVYCCVPLCKSQSGKSNGLSKVSFHEFPSKENLRIQWIINIARKGLSGEIWVPTEHSRVCSLHFKPEDYKEDSIRNLKLNTIPTVFDRYPKYMLPQTKVSRQKVKRPNAISRKEKIVQKNKDPVLTESMGFENLPSQCTKAAEPHICEHDLSIATHFTSLEDYSYQPTKCLKIESAQDPPVIFDCPLSILTNVACSKQKIRINDLDETNINEDKSSASSNI